MTKYWIEVASHEPVQRGVKGGFAQVAESMDLPGHKRA